MRVALFGYGGRVGSVVLPALEQEGHEVVGIEEGDERDVHGCIVAVDFTRPDVAAGNAMAALQQGAAPVVGTSGIDEEGLHGIDGLAREQGLPALVVPNFAIGAVLMMRFAAEAARWMPRAEIIELHHDGKVDAPSGTSQATAERMGGDVPIHSVRLPGLVAHQEVILGGHGETLTIRHDSTSRDSFVSGVLLAVEGVRALPPGLTLGLDALL